MHVIEDTALADLLAELGITGAILAAKGLPRYAVAAEVALAEAGADGQHHMLTPGAAAAWQAMKQAALGDGIVLEIVSAFRTLEDQAEIIRDKLARRMPMDRILMLSAPPGYSEHHSGRAVDINTPGCEPREEPFEHTAAFAWLQRNAGRHGFRLSYPRGNALGFIYEPWHWYWTPEGDAA
ncbi:M15 family metallopeptidase [Noviherbaspirillum aridicola]|uniref:Peptidase n=1 Tax=Noviherbaspirillum aridicola TaxID=2849687 RepID=A0ABQ4PZV1_9BURK|nr:M15 family metallopeptidase [Noviherbaspirillum aridicola]GIZ50059.1 peptidase [Noviherbaspirillum aridicola]